VARVKFCFCYR